MQSLILSRLSLAELEIERDEMIAHISIEKAKIETLQRRMKHMMNYLDNIHDQIDCTRQFTLSKDLGFHSHEGIEVDA